MAQPVGKCQPGSSREMLDVNNAGALVTNQGDFLARYVVPKDGGVGSVYSAALWVGGKVNGELRLSASYAGRHEFWPGPLTESGVLPDRIDCSPFDRIISISRADLLAVNRLGIVTNAVRDWPALYGAPVIDGDGVPNNYCVSCGDRPEVEGHHMLWWISNDVGNVHSSSGSPPVGVETCVSAFAVSSDTEAIDNATFYRYRIRYTGDRPLDSAFVAIWTDPDLGDHTNDYAGVDTLRDLAFFYGADESDYYYGTPHPALGFRILQGPLLDDDHEGAREERLGLTSFTLPRRNVPGAYGEPRKGREFHNAMRGRWRDGSAQTVGGTGDALQGTATRFLYPGDPVTESYWSALNVDASGTDAPRRDIRSVLGMGPFKMQPGEEQEITFAIVWARGSDRLDSITKLRENSDVVADLFVRGFDDDTPLSIVAPTTAPAPLAPAGDAYDLATQTTFRWQPLDGATAYLFSLAPDESFNRDVSHVIVRGSAALAVDMLHSSITYYWQVRAVNSAGIGPPSRPRRFTTSPQSLVSAGMMRLNDGRPAVVEISGPRGTDPCGGDPADLGCRQGFGNAVIGESNATDDYSILLRSENLEAFAPNDFEIRFTETGSYARGVTDKLIWVPFEIWDIGPTAAGAENDPGDDIQMVPSFRSGYADSCAFGYFHAGSIWRSTDRISAVHATPSYAEFAKPATDEGSPKGECIKRTNSAGIEPLCPDPFTLSFSGNPNAENYRMAGPPEGTIIRIYSQGSALAPPIPAAPRDGARVLETPRLYWSGRHRTHVQIAYDPAFNDVVEEDTVAASDYLPTLIDAKYYWRIRTIRTRGPASGWSEVSRFTTGVDESRLTTLQLDRPFPNPASDTTVIPFGIGESDVVTMELYDVTGRRVRRARQSFDEGWNEVRIDVENLPSGTYYYRLTAANDIESGSLVIVH